MVTNHMNFHVLCDVPLNFQWKFHYFEVTQPQLPPNYLTPHTPKTSHHHPPPQTPKKRSDVWFELRLVWVTLNTRSFLNTPLSHKTLFTETLACSPGEPPKHSEWMKLCGAVRRSRAGGKTETERDTPRERGRASFIIIMFLNKREIKWIASSHVRLIRWFLSRLTSLSN